MKTDSVLSKTVQIRRAATLLHSEGFISTAHYKAIVEFNNKGIGGEFVWDITCPVCNGKLWAR